jgi:hypothetical protein
LTCSQGLEERTPPDIEPDETEARLLSELDRTECVSGEDEGECEAARLVRAMEARSMAAGGKQDKLISCGCGHQRRPTWPSKGQRTRIFQTLLANTDRLATLLLIDDLGGLYESRELSVGVVAGQARSTVRIRTIAKLRSTMRSQLRSTFSSSPSGPLGFWIAAGSGMWSSSSDSNSHSSGCCSRWWPERLPQPRWPP